MAGEDDADLFETITTLLYLCLALASEVDVASLHLLPDDSRVDQEQATSHLSFWLLVNLLRMTSSKFIDNSIMRL